LHPFLEDGCGGKTNPNKKVKLAFIGISNLSLDPAKMNRGIFLQRDKPSKEELIQTAR